MTKEELSKLMNNSKVIYKGKVCRVIAVNHLNYSYFQLIHNREYIRADNIFVGFFGLTRHKEQVKSMILIDNNI